MFLAYGIVLAKKGTYLFLLNQFLSLLHLAVSPLIRTSGQAPSPLMARTAGKGKLEVLGEKPGHLVAQGAYTGKADFI